MNLLWILRRKVCFNNIYNKMIGVYKIISPTNKIYIGQSINIEQRWKQYNKLYYSLKKHNPKNHIFKIIEECKESNLLEKETYWKNYYKVLEIPSLYIISNSTSLNGGATLFLTILTLTLFPTISLPSLITSFLRISIRTEA